MNKKKIQVLNQNPIRGNESTQNERQDMRQLNERTSPNILLLCQPLRLRVDHVSAGYRVHLAAHRLNCSDLQWKWPSNIIDTKRRSTTAQSDPVGKTTETITKTPVTTL